MKKYKIFKQWQFNKTPMNLFIKKYEVINNKINHIDFCCDFCKNQEYNITDYIYLHISFKGYCEFCYNGLINKTIKIKEENKNV
jgi:hypothetical protein